MKKNIFILLLLLLLLLFVSLTYSQQTLKVEYKQIYNTSSPISRSAILEINQSNSIYVSLMRTTKLLKSEQEILNEKESKSNDNATHLMVNIGSNNDDFYLYDLKKQKLIFISDVGDKRFLIEDNFTINWQITTETKTIANYKTYKAITKFRGRVWEAWFAPDLVYPYGPWKLHGLPGLILEAYDDTKTYNYLATKIYKDDFKIEFNTNELSKITFRNFLDLKEEHLDNMFNSILKGRDNVKFVRSSGSKPQEFDFEWETPTK